MTEWHTRPGQQCAAPGALRISQLGASEAGSWVLHSFSALVLPLQILRELTQSMCSSRASCCLRGCSEVAPNRASVSQLHRTRGWRHTVPNRLGAMSSRQSKQEQLQGWAALTRLPSLHPVSHLPSLIPYLQNGNDDRSTLEE